MKVASMVEMWVVLMVGWLVSTKVENLVLMKVEKMAGVLVEN